MQKQAVLSLSGGMDSSTLLILLLQGGYNVTCLSFDYGQKHRIELSKANQLVEYLRSKTGHKIPHQVIELRGLSPLLNSNLVEGGEDVPEGHYENENMRETVVPNRNKIFASIIQAVALSIAKDIPEDDVVDICMGIHAGDHVVYPDCRQEFRDADFSAFVEGNYDTHKVSISTPFIDTDKFGILQVGERACKKLGIDFNQVYKRTFTSYKPITIQPETRKLESKEGEEVKYYADYKSASSVERVEAFIKLGRPDPCEYADETGIVTWEEVKTHVEEILKSNVR